MPGLLPGGVPAPPHLIKSIFALSEPLVTQGDRRIGRITQPMGGPADTLPTIVQDNFSAHIYMFEAKRFAVGECSHEDTTDLRPDAANLELR
jgi:hypothetical protein